MNLNWFLSRTVRHATHMRKHVWKLLSAQRDLLAPQAVDAVTAAVRSIRETCETSPDRKAIEAQMKNLEEVANKWLKPYPQAAIRENVEVLLVAIAVAMGIRTFIAQPFKIPTGSMQPTLYGVTSTPNFMAHRDPADDDESEDFEVPSWLKAKLLYWFTGVGYTHVIAKDDGELRVIDEAPQKFLLFNLKQSFYVGREKHTVWFPPDNLLRRAGLVEPRFGQPLSRTFKKGDTVIKMKSYSGDHLFVDRLTYNFRRPTRGEIVVFETRDIRGMDLSQQGQFYIKRLIGLGGEKIRIADDRHVYINGKKIDSATPNFEKVYSFNPAELPKDSRYSGHLNGSYLGRSAPQYFPDGETEFAVPPGDYVVMGDNSANSSDSRYWGSFPRENVIGRSFMVYWPIGRQDGRSSRFGWGNK
jgi:signal peptidase I